MSDKKPREQIVRLPIGIYHYELDATFSQICDELLIGGQHVITNKLRGDHRRSLVGHIFPNLNEIQKACRQHTFEQVFPELQPVVDDPPYEPGWS